MVKVGMFGVWFLVSGWAGKSRVLRIYVLVITIVGSFH